MENIDLSNYHNNTDFQLDLIYEKIRLIIQGSFDLLRAGENSKKYLIKANLKAKRPRGWDITINSRTFSELNLQEIKKAKENSLTNVVGLLEHDLINDPFLIVDSEEILIFDEILKKEIGNLKEYSYIFQDPKFKIIEKIKESKLSTILVEESKPKIKTFVFMRHVDYFVADYNKSELRIHIKNNKNK